MSVILWADAICIDQIDNDEKSHQVQQMRRVYEMAESTLVWLGPAADNSDILIDGVHQSYALYQKHDKFTMSLDEYLELVIPLTPMITFMARGCQGYRSFKR